MFEEYLFDSGFFYKTAYAEEDEEKARRYYRVTIFCLLCAIESSINYFVQALELSKAIDLHEIAYLSDRKIELKNDNFVLTEKTEFHRLENKLRFLLKRYCLDYDFETDASWPRFMQLKQKRDELVHPREDVDDTEIDAYISLTLNGINSVIDLINYLSQGIFDRELRPKILDIKI